MADNDNEQLSVESMEQVAKNLAELLTNSVNMADIYYEVFFDNNPHYVELQRYDSNGELITTLIPNRAMDRSIAFYGTIDPENEVEAYLGALYINTTTRNLFIKKTPEGKLGWTNITPQKVETHRETYAVNSMTTSQQLVNAVESKDYIDVYVNGVHLEDADFTIGSDYRTLHFLKQFPDYSTMQVVYTTGLYGLKGDTALTLHVGQTTTIEPGQPANVVNSGSDENIVLDFYIPQGEKGESGVYVGVEDPEHGRPSEEDNVWIDPTGEGETTDDLSVTRIFDSGKNTNPTAYNKAYEIMHSTVDLEKFTILGDVDIDDRNIMTTHSSGSGIRTPIQVSRLADQTWSISGRDYIDATVSDDNQYFFSIGQTVEGTYLTFFYKGSDGHFILRQQSGSSNHIIWNEPDFYRQLDHLAGWYNWKIEYKNGAYYCYLSYDKNPLILLAVVEEPQMSVAADAYVYIKGYNDLVYSHHKSDLACFTITVNGKVIYNTNNTENVHIAENQYIKYGNPIITDEGIMIGVLDGSDFIYGDYTAGQLLNKDWTIKGHFRHIGTSEVLFQFANPEQIETVDIDTNIYEGDYKMLSVETTAAGKCIFHLYTGTSDSHSIHVSHDFDIEQNKDYYYRYSYDVGTYKYTFELSEVPTFATSETYSYTANTPNKNPFVANVHPDYKIVLGSSSVVSTGEKRVYNNLNYFRITNIEKTVFAPMFVIPCTISAYGAKFAYETFRELVNEAYEIYHVGDIFIIDEVARAVTLPLDDIYSLIEKEYSTRYKVGKGLLLNEHTNTISNLAEGLEIGDIGESPQVDERINTRRVLNGQVLHITDDLIPFYKYVKNLNSALRVTEEEWQAEVTQTGECNKFVLASVTETNTVHYYAFIPERFVIRTPIIPDDEPTPEPDTDPAHLDGNAGYYLEGDNISVNDIVAAQQAAQEEQEQQSDEPAPEIEYETTISEDLTEANIIYTTSLNILATGTVYTKINNIIYPNKAITVADLLNDELYERYDVADFEREEESEAVEYIRIPKLIHPRMGYQYYIQIATGVDNSVYLENNYTNLTPFCYGMYQYSDVDLNNPGWLESNGSWYQREVYPTFYDWIKAKAEENHNETFVQPIFSASNDVIINGEKYQLSASHGTPYWAFNGDWTTGEQGWWSNHGATSESNPCWICFKAPRPIKFSGIDIENETATPASFKTCQIFVGHDGENWKQVCTIENPNNDAGYICSTTFDWTNTVDTFTQKEIEDGFEYMYIKFIESWSTGGVSVQEIKIYGEWTHSGRFKKYNNPSYSVTPYDFVVDEVDQTFRLPLLANACDYGKMRFLVEKREPTESDPRWYNLYSDGWLEQGGTLLTISGRWSSTARAVPFLKPYLDTSYSRFTSPKNLADGAYGTGISFSAVTNSSFSISFYNCINNETIWWETKGYTQKPDFDTYRHLLPKLYYYVGDTIQSRKEINVGELANEVANMRSLPMLTAPSKSYVDIPCPAHNNVVVSPGDGWLSMRRTSTAANQYVGLFDQITGMGELQWIAVSGNWAQITIPVYKGEQINVHYNAGTLNFLRFYPSGGNN